MPKSQKKTTMPIKQVTTKAAKNKIIKSTRSAPDKKAANIKEHGLQGSKQSILITLLQRPAGATVEEMAKITGWQKHSVLGALSGVLKKRLGLSIDSAKEERGRVYRVTGSR